MMSNVSFRRTRRARLLRAKVPFTKGSLPRSVSLVPYAARSETESARRTEFAFDAGGK